MAAYLLTVFVAAFLLFQVQPVMARAILPWWGGSPAVWTTCMLFFQVGLLLGYSYAHLIAKIRRPSRQVAIHLGLLALSLAVLPIAPNLRFRPTGDESAPLSIILLLLSSVGIPYVLVASTSPLLQHWFSRRYPDRSPYRLYALSNVGSLLGLLTFPFLVEPLLGLKTQTLSWSAGYGLFVLACAWCALPLLRMAAEERQAPGAAAEDGSSGAGSNWILWLLLAACGVTVYLACTNQMCQDVAVVPFLWVLPLSLYLLSFVICFDSSRWYRRGLWIPVLVLAVSLVVTLMHLDSGQRQWDLRLQIFTYCAALFACCMVCHGELYRLRPPARRLTAFYLLVTLGGALGGFFVSIVAPVIFKGYWELHLGLLGTAVLAGICLFRGKVGRSQAARRTPRIVWGAAVLVLAVLLGTQIQERQEGTLTTRRGFYGILRVYERNVGIPLQYRALYHGRIDHGKQYLILPDRPTSYFGPASGVGRTLLAYPGRERGLRVGVAGLGAGILTCYARPQDSFRFYEINPQVEDVAREYFSYLEDAEAEVAVVIGDARVSLERELARDGPQRFHVLVLDAFSGDALPVHLLTREAFQLYWKHLEPDGVLAINISNWHLDLSPVVRNLARAQGKAAVWIPHEAASPFESHSEWVLVTSNQDFLRQRDVMTGFYRWPLRVPRPVEWTDDYSNLLSVLRE